MRTQRNTYTAYSIGCAAVWGIILLLGRGGWWVGWTSATVARIGYPPPEPLTPASEKRLRIISSVLVALGLASTVRMFVTGKQPPGSTPDPELRPPSHRLRSYGLSGECAISLGRWDGR